jgi:hypothetical protein
MQSKNKIKLISQDFIVSHKVSGDGEMLTAR